MTTGDAAGRPNFETHTHPKNLYGSKTETPPGNPPKNEGSLMIRERGRGQGCRRGVPMRFKHKRFDPCSVWYNIGMESAESARTRTENMNES